MLAWKTEGTRLYQRLPAELHQTLQACEPLTEVEPNRPRQEMVYANWKKEAGK